VVSACRKKLPYVIVLQADRMSSAVVFNFNRQ
jgi:hypothetical protein